MVTYLYILHCMDFSVNSRWWGEGEMMRPSVQGVDPPVCCTPGCYCYICKRQLCGFPQCAASWMTYARDSFVDSPSGAFCPLEGGAQTHWHQSYRHQHNLENSTKINSSKIKSFNAKPFIVIYRSSIILGTFNNLAESFIVLTPNCTRHTVWMQNGGWQTAVNLIIHLYLTLNYVTASELYRRVHGNIMVFYNAFVGLKNNTIMYAQYRIWIGLFWYRIRLKMSVSEWYRPILNIRSAKPLDETI